MMITALPSQQKNQKTLLYFIAAWTIINVLQACLIGLDGDETYYWTYSRHLQWGYFDHPPMVALSIKLGELFGHGYLYTRIGAILFSAATVYFGFKALPDKLQNANWYVLVFASVLVFHVYGFVTTPDPPLLFFTAVFFYAYKRYLIKDDFLNVLLLAASITGMIYSKYHGVLPVLFVFLSNLNLVKRKSAWLVVLLVLLAFLPHLWWQYIHDWPTVTYHLFERNRGAYKIEKTTNYILGQLLILGPFTTIVVLISFLKKKLTGDLYFRAHLFTFFGILAFFLLSSFKKNIEPHWTLTAGVSFLVLTLALLESAADKFRKLYAWLALANIFLVVVARILLVIPNTPARNIDRFQVQLFSKAWADSLYKHAAGTPVVFIDNYTYPSLYQYHHPDQIATCYSTVTYRKNNYTLQDYGILNNKTIYAVRRHRISEDDLEIKSSYVPTFLHKIDSFKAISGLKIIWLNQTEQAEKGRIINAELELFNPLAFTINAGDLFLNYTFLKTRTEYITSGNVSLPEAELSPGFKKRYPVQLSFPSKPGKYRLVFSFNQPLAGPVFSSDFYEVEVD